MKLVLTILRMLVRLVGVVLLVLGVLIWTSHTDSHLHIQLGFILTLSLIALVIVGAVRRVSFSVLAVGLLIAVLLPVVGLAQRSWMPGASHWLVQVLHLAIGLCAIGIGEVIGKRAAMAPDLLRT